MVNGELALHQIEVQILDAAFAFQAIANELLFHRAVHVRQVKSAFVCISVKRSKSRGRSFDFAEPFEQRERRRRRAIAIRRVAPHKINWL
jgi:hypothetical protein